VEVIQNEGETIFVPSGWYHQVSTSSDSRKTARQATWTDPFYNLNVGREPFPIQYPLFSSNSSFDFHLGSFFSAVDSCVNSHHEHQPQLDQLDELATDVRYARRRHPLLRKLDCRHPGHLPVTRGTWLGSGMDARRPGAGRERLWLGLGWVLEDGRVWCSGEWKLDYELLRFHSWL
jgi:hypothetical protein